MQYYSVSAAWAAGTSRRLRLQGDLSFFTSTLHAVAIWNVVGKAESTLVISQTESTRSPDCTVCFSHALEKPGSQAGHHIRTAANNAFSKSHSACSSFREEDGFLCSLTHSVGYDSSFEKCEHVWSFRITSHISRIRSNPQ